MNMSTPSYATGPLVLVEQSQAGEYVGLDPEDGAVVFRLRTEPDGVMNYAVEGGSFIAVPTEERTILIDRESGEVTGVVQGGLGEWEVIGDRLVVASPEGLIAYDGHGREAWSREMELLMAPARAILAWSPDTPPARADALLVWERGRGLVAIDEGGAARWVYPLTVEEAWSRVMQRGDRVFLAEGATMLDARTGAVLFECPGGCAIDEHDEQGLLVSETGPGEGVALALYGYDGVRRWRYAPGLVDERGAATAPSAALLADVIATCAPGGPVTFLDRADGSVLSTHPLPPRDPERDGSPYCALYARDELVLAATDRPPRSSVPPVTSPRRSPSSSTPSRRRPRTDRRRSGRSIGSRRWCRRPKAPPSPTPEAARPTAARAEPSRPSASRRRPPASSRPTVPSPAPTRARCSGSVSSAATTRA